MLKHVLRCYEQHVRSEQLESYLLGVLAKWLCYDLPVLDLSVLLILVSLFWSYHNIVLYWCLNSLYFGSILCLNLRICLSGTQVIYHLWSLKQFEEKITQMKQKWKSEWLRTYSHTSNPKDQITQKSKQAKFMWNKH